MRHVIKNRQLRHADGTVPTENLWDVHKCLFQSEFENAHEGLADVTALRKILFESNLALTAENIVNNSQTVNFSTAEIDVNYLDLIFHNKLYDETDNSVIKKSPAKKLADSCLTLDALRNLYTSHGAHGVAALLSNPPSSSKGKSPRGTKCAITLQKIVNYLKSHP